MPETPFINSFYLSVKRASDASRRYWLRLQIWQTEVDLESIEQERRRLDQEARTAILMRASLLAQLHSVCHDMARLPKRPLDARWARPREALKRIN